MLTLLAEESARAFNEAGVAAAIVLTAIGMVLHWYQPQHRMHLEERVKDGKISSAEAHRQIVFYNRFAPVATLLGVVVLCFVLIDLMD
jgi:hypothetical protein